MLHRSSFLPEFLTHDVDVDEEANHDFCDCRSHGTVIDVFVVVVVVVVIVIVIVIVVVYCHCQRQCYCCTWNVNVEHS
jgi:hypothetical protein